MDYSKDIAYIASNNYFSKKTLSFGVGVIGSFDAEIAKKDTIRQKYLNTLNCWYEIEIPSRNTFFNLDVSINNNSESVKSSLFSSKALSMLYIDEGKDYLKKIDSFVNSKPQEERQFLAKEEIKYFYQKRQQELLNLRSVASLIQYITLKSRPKDIWIASSFFAHFGISGVIYSEKEEERFLLFDAKNDISIIKANFDKLENCKFSDSIR